MDRRQGRMEAVAMFSADGEKVDFLNPVVLEGAVEVYIYYIFFIM